MADTPAPKPGFDYWVSDAQLQVFLSRSPSERLAWLEQMRAFTIRVAPAEAQAHWRRLRSHR
jgi:hypothetical protein